MINFLEEALRKLNPKQFIKRDPHRSFFTNALLYPKSYLSPTESTSFKLLHLLLFRMHTIWKFHPRRIFNFSALYYLMSNSLPNSLSCYWSVFHSYDTYLFFSPLFLYLFVLSCILFRAIDLFSQLRHYSFVFRPFISLFLWFFTVLFFALLICFP